MVYVTYVTVYCLVERMTTYRNDCQFHASLSLSLSLCAIVLSDRARDLPETGGFGDLQLPTCRGRTTRRGLVLGLIVATDWCRLGVAS